MHQSRIIIAGSLAQRPGIGGHAWVFLQYLLGFKRLGWDVLFLDWLEPKMCIDEAGHVCAVQDSWNLRYLESVMREYGLGEAWSVDYNDGAFTYGVPRDRVLAFTKDADLLLNVMGFLRDPEVLGSVRRRAFLDIDPGFGQMWQDLGWAKMFKGHDVYVTIGEKIGAVDCAIPTCGLPWVTTAQPVVLEQWPEQEANCNRDFTGIMSWRGPFGPVEYKGKTYGLRVHEFRKLADLPLRTSARFQVALDIDPKEIKDISLLEKHGWRLVNPRQVADTPKSYRAFIQQSGAELMIAKNMYVASRSGWFSDRSLCYLASGKPVLAQDTGFTERYPTGEGLVAFTTLEEAIAGVESIGQEYPRHCRAARALAEEYFDSDKILTRLLEKVT